MLTSVPDQQTARLLSTSMPWVFAHSHWHLVPHRHVSESTVSRSLPGGHLNKVTKAKGSLYCPCSWKVPIASRLSHQPFH